jgi:hypothetical protein
VSIQGASTTVHEYGKRVIQKLIQPDIGNHHMCQNICIALENRLLAPCLGQGPPIVDRTSTFDHF